jgi:hypothetical protein
MELGDGEGSDKTEKHTANHFTSRVNTMLVHEAPGMHILFKLAKIFHSSTETSLQNAIF